MKIIISPAKKMVECNDWMEPVSEPVFSEDADMLRQLLAGLDRPQLKTLFRANDEIVELNYQRYHTPVGEAALSPALLSYVGLQYQSMAPKVFTQSQWGYVQEHLRILSGLYGILRPGDGVMPYRLEMQAKLAVNDFCDLYSYWGKRIYEDLAVSDGTILNLASKEYSKAVEPYLDGNVSMVTCVFGEMKDGNVKVKATAAKTARGDMVSWLAENRICQVKDVKYYNRLNYEFISELSDDKNYIFLSRKNT